MTIGDFHNKQASMYPSTSVSKERQVRDYREFEDNWVRCCKCGHRVWGYETEPQTLNTWCFMCWDDMLIEEYFKHWGEKRHEVQPRVSSEPGENE